MIMSITSIICPKGAGIGKSDTQYATKPSMTNVRIIDMVLFIIFRVFRS